MADVRITKAMRFTAIREVVAAANDEIASPEVRADLDAFLVHEMDLLARKHSTKSGLTTTQKENEDVKGLIAATLAENVAPMKSTDIGAAVGIGVQKATALLSQMVKAGTVVRAESKGKATFTV